MHSCEYKCRASSEWQPSIYFAHLAPRLPPPHWPPNVTGKEKKSKSHYFSYWGDSKPYTLPRRYKSQLLPQGSRPKLLHLKSFCLPYSIIYHVGQVRCGIHRTHLEPSVFVKYPFTVDSCYLKDQGTLWNTLKYPYLDILDLQNWGKSKLNNHISQI